MKIPAIVLLFLWLSGSVTAGDFCIAPQFAYVKSASQQLHADSYEPEIFHLFRTSDDFIILRTGVAVLYQQKWFSCITGLSYGRMIIENYNFGNLSGLNIVQLPLGSNFYIGKKLYTYLHIGAYLNYQYRKGPESEFRFARFKPGITGGIGMGYRFSSSLAVDILYRAEDSIYPMYYDWSRASNPPGGYAYWKEMYVPLRILTLNIMYTLRRKKQ